jgi:hypothetical protein
MPNKAVLTKAKLVLLLCGVTLLMGASGFASCAGRGGPCDRHCYEMKDCSKAPECTCNYCR